MSRHDTEHNRNRTRERPRDDYGRFESEADWRGGRDTRRFAGDENYAWRDQDRRGGNYDREYQGANDWSRGYDMGGSDRYDREFGRPPEYQDRGDGRSFSGSGRFDQRSREYRGATRYEYDRPQYSRQAGFNDEYNWTGGSTPGNSYRVESLFGAGTGYRGNISSDRPMDRGSYMASYVGKGPKGYRRSDDRIEEDVNEALSQHPEIDASDIEVKVSNGEVTLTGSVTERQYKRMAEDIVERCSGVHDIHNEIRVQRDAETATHQQMKPKSATGAGNKSAEARTA